MKYIKFLMLNVIVFGTLFTLISLLFPSVIQTTKTINIGGGQTKIAAKLANVAGWGSWNNFVVTDIAVKPITTTDSMAVTTQWKFNKGRNLNCQIAVYAAAADSIPVSFTVTEKLQWYPWKKFSALVSDKAMGNAIEVSLQNLKKQIELTP
jgi:hypothetical protein